MSKLLNFKALLLTSIVQNIITVNTDCDVCGANQFCRTACERPFDPRITSSVSLSHCGLASFRAEKKRSKVEPRIWNGKNSDKREFPWIVELFKKWKGDSVNPIRYTNPCGGILITPRYVLTAAHCKYELATPSLKNIGVMFGTNRRSNTNRTEFTMLVDELVAHPDYKMDDPMVFYDDDKSMTSDIMLMKLKRDIDIKVSDHRFNVNTVCLPKKTKRIFSSHAIASGWGLVNQSLNSQPDLLQKTELQIPSYKKCATMMRETKLPEEFITEGLTDSELLIRFATRYNTSKVICALATLPPGGDQLNMSSTPYKGDSGSPLVQIHNGRGYDIGVTSAGLVDYNAPIVLYTSVAYYVDWIKQVVAGRYNGKVFKVKHDL